MVVAPVAATLFPAILMVGSEIRDSSAVKLRVTISPTRAMSLLYPLSLTRATVVSVGTVRSNVTLLPSVVAVAVAPELPA